MPDPTVHRSVNATLTALCARLTAVTAVRPVDYTDHLGAAILAEVLDGPSRTEALLLAALYTAHAQPGRGDTVEQAVAAVAAAEADLDRGFRVADDGAHDDRCSWATGCDACTAHWQQLLDEALDALLGLLDGQARRHLEQVAAVGAGQAAA